MNKVQKTGIQEQGDISRHLECTENRYNIFVHFYYTRKRIMQDALPLKEQ